MKKIGYVNPDSSLLKWMIGQLQAAQSEFTGAVQMASALSDLLEGEYASILMEADGSEPVSPPAAAMQFGELIINPKSRRVTRSGEKIDLTPKEFDILYFLARNRGEVFTREQIYEAVWEDDFAQGDNNIMTFIRRLRKKIEPNPDDPQYVLTVWGTGYKFTEEL